MDHQSPRFSIIMPTFNRANLIEKGINSVLKQTFVSWELIIVDDGSTDKTAEVVSSYSDSRIRYVHQNHGERSRARNRGIEEAKGEYLCFLDDDDYILPLFLKDFEGYLKAEGYPEIIVRTGFYRQVNDQLRPSVNYDSTQHRNPVYFAAFNMCSASSLCIPKKIMKAHLFPENIHYWEDSYLILQLLAKYPMVQLPSYNYVYILHENMSSRQFYQSPELMEKIRNNMQTIESFFVKYDDAIRSFLPTWTKDYLIADKYLDHAMASLNHTSKSISFNLVKAGMQSMVFHRQLLRKYLFWVYLFIFNRK